MVSHIKRPNNRAWPEARPNTLSKVTVKHICVITMQWIKNDTTKYLMYDWRARAVHLRCEYQTGNCMQMHGCSHSWIICECTVCSVCSLYYHERRIKIMDLIAGIEKYMQIFVDRCFISMWKQQRRSILRPPIQPAISHAVIENHFQRFYSKFQVHPSNWLSLR